MKCIIDYTQIYKNEYFFNKDNTNFNKKYFIKGISNKENAIYLLEKYLCDVEFYNMSENPAAIYILEKDIYFNKINWEALSLNPAPRYLK